MKKWIASLLTLGMIITSTYTPVVARTMSTADLETTYQTTTTKTSTYETRDSYYDLNDNSINRATSEHFQVIWGNEDTTGLVTKAFVEGNLKNLEMIRQFYLEELGMDDPGVSTNSSIKGNYKTNLYIAATGLTKIETDWAYMSVDQDGFGYMVMAPGALRVDPPSWVVPHEYAHVVTYHQKGVLAGGWYESMANWFRDQYLGSTYYRYGNTVYGPTSDFFQPLVLNSHVYFPHLTNWYDTWPILTYVQENPDQLQGLGLSLMQELLNDQVGGTLFEQLERLSGTSIKDILGGYARRMATVDFERQDHYRSYLDELLSNTTYRNQIYTTLEISSAGYLKVPAGRAPQQGGYNVIPITLQKNAKLINVDFKGTSSINGADYRVSLVAETAFGETRYSSLWNTGTGSLALQGDETALYLVVCATPDTMSNLDIFADSSTAPQYPYEVKINFSEEATPLPTPSPTVPPTPTPSETPSIQDAIITPSEVTFDKASTSVEPLRLVITENGNILTGLKGEGASLKNDQDYRIVTGTSWGTVLELNTSYLSQFVPGTYTITATFDLGQSQNITLHIIGAPVPEVSPTPEVSPSPKVLVEMYNNAQDTLSNTISPIFKLTSLNESPIDLSTLTLNYYYTIEEETPQSFWCDWSSVDSQNIKGIFIPLADKDKADYCLAITFNPETGTLKSGGSIYINCRFAKADWSDYNQSNDYSFLKGASSYMPNDHITLYQDNILISGIAP